MAEATKRYLASLKDPAQAHRRKDPCNEFEHNGWNLMLLFRHVVPLMRLRRVVSDDNTSLVLRTWPLRAKASLKTPEMRHLLTQYTNVFATCFPLICVLANQTQRHAVVRSMNAMVKTATFHRLMGRMQQTGFWSEVEWAMNNVEHKKAKALLKELRPYFTIVGRDKPWGRMARGAFKAKILGVSERHGYPSFFITVSLDDAHQLLSIRLSFSSQSNEGFPAYAQAAHLNDGHRRQQVQREMDVDMAQLLKDLRQHETRTINSAAGDVEFKFDEAGFQRLANQNPVATTLMYERFTSVFLEVLLGLPSDRRRRVTTPMLDVPQLGGDVIADGAGGAGNASGAANANAGSSTRRSARVAERPTYATPTRRSCRGGEHGRQHAHVPHVSGICSIVTAHVNVTEESSRKALHQHNATWTALSPRLLARHAADGDVRAKIIEAIESMVKADFGWEVHAVQAGMKTLKRPQHRVSLQDWPATLQEARVLTPVQACQLGEHSKCVATCAKGISGYVGCRSMFNKPHESERSRFMQVEESAYVDFVQMANQLAK